MKKLIFFSLALLFGLQATAMGNKKNCDLIELVNIKEELNNMNPICESAELQKKAQDVLQRLLNINKNETITDSIKKLTEQTPNDDDALCAMVNELPILVERIQKGTNKNTLKKQLEELNDNFTDTLALALVTVSDPTASPADKKNFVKQALVYVKSIKELDAKNKEITALKKQLKELVESPGNLTNEMAMELYKKIENRISILITKTSGSCISAKSVILVGTVILCIAAATYYFKK